MKPFRQPLNHIDESIRGHRFAVGRRSIAYIIAKNFGSMVVGASAFVWGIVAWLEIHKSLSGGALVWSYLLETTSIALVSSSAALWGVMRYYHSRYNQFRTGSIVKEMYSDRTWLISHYREFLQEFPEKEVIAVGVSLHTLTTLPDLKGILQQALTEKQSLNYHFVYLDPESPVVAQREREEDRESGRIAMDCRSNIHTAFEVKASLGDLGNRFHVHVSSNIAPVGFFLLSDNELFIEPYLSGVGRTAPIFRLQRNEHNGEVWDGYYKYLKILTATPSSPAPHEMARCMITDAGHSSSRSTIRPALFLDRDGVLIYDKHYIENPSDVELLPGVPEALKEVQDRFRIVVVTNQSGVARGLFTESEVRSVNKRMLALLAAQGVIIDAIYYCPHLPEGSVKAYACQCQCRKPLSGMFFQATKDLNLDLSRSITIGDKQSDIEAGNAAGTRSIRVGRSEDSPGSLVADGLMSAIQISLREFNNGV